MAEAFLHLLCGFGIGSSMSGTAGYFHKSQILEVDHAKKTVTFRYKSCLDLLTKEKSYKTVAMDIYEFMAKILYFLPKKQKKMVRYYGIYAHGPGEKLSKITNAT